MLTYVITYHIGKHLTQILVPKSHGLAHCIMGMVLIKAGLLLQFATSPSCVNA